MIRYKEITMPADAFMGILQRHMLGKDTRICGSCKYFRTYTEEPGNSTCQANYDYANAWDETCPLYEVDDRCCGKCAHFSNESASGAGYCDKLDSAWCYADSNTCDHYEERSEA